MCTTSTDKQLDMSKPRSTAAAAALVLVVVASTLLLLMAPPASAARPQRHMLSLCDPSRDILVNQTAGSLQPDGSKLFDVEVTNEARSPLWDVHLNCGYQFRSVPAVDEFLLSQVRPGDCLLINGSTIAPGGRITFSYTGYVRYSMAVVHATCAGRRP